MNVDRETIANARVLMVGAGGIGVLLQGSIDLFSWQTVATILLAIVVLVILGEALTSALRKKVI